MANLCIVAIPAADDDIWQESSEKVPHMTILFLGDAMSNPNVSKIVEYVKKQASNLEPFSIIVDHRGTMGPDNADVLYFDDDDEDLPWQLVDFRRSLLYDTNIKSAYEALPQFVEWQPHVTLGYPATPAKEYKLDPGETDYITFDRVAVWYGDYEGTEITLTANPSPPQSDLAVPDSAWSEPLGNILSHHGIKGMRWGVRGGVGTPRAASVTQKGKKKLKGTGGEGHPAHKDAVSARTLGQKAKKSGHQSLSNEELQKYATRLNLEQSVKRLEQNDKSGARRFISGLVKGQGNQQANQLASKGTAAGVKKAFAVAGVAAV